MSIKKTNLTNIKENLNPKNINDMIGFDFLFSKNSIVNKMIESNKLMSILLFGPPGTGKSLSIKMILKKLDVEYFMFNSTTDNKSDLTTILKTATKDNKVVVVIEEIHRLNKDKQDLLLYYLEEELIYLFATTTENPFFVVNPAIRSRLCLYEIKRVDENILIDQLNDYLKAKNIDIDNKVIETIVYKANSDFRQIFMYIDIVLSMYKDNTTSEIIENLFNYNTSTMDKNATNFYDNLSAYHKSIRGSDPDAAIFYLAKLLQDNNMLPIFRRLYAIAYEDIGMANPKIGPDVHAAIEAAKAIGLPEARIPLANITIELALSPKSNSAISAVDEAINLLNNSDYSPPHHIRDNHYKSATKLGVSGYKYPHNYVNNWVEQQYLPDKIKNKKFYKKNPYSTYETKLYEYWYKIKHGE